MSKRSIRFRLIGLLGVIAVLLAALAVSLPDPSASAALAWKTVMVDDFNGTEGSKIDSAKWLYTTGTSYSYPGAADHFGTHEKQTYTDSARNCAHDGKGHFQIKLIRDAHGNWTSCRIETQSTSFAAPAGGQLRMECRLKLPNPRNGLGYWSACWALGDSTRPVGATNWPGPGEPDIMESVNGLTTHSQGLHCGTETGGPCNEHTGLSSGQISCGNCKTAYHTYWVELDRRVAGHEEMRFGRDGTTNYTVEQTNLPAATWNEATHHGFYMIANVAVGGDYPDALSGGVVTPTGSTSSGAAMSLDQIKVSIQPASIISQPTPTPTPSPNPTPTPVPGAGTAYKQFQIEKANEHVGLPGRKYKGAKAGKAVRGNNGDFARFNRLNFGSKPAKRLELRLKTTAPAGVSGTLTARLDSKTGPVLGHGLEIGHGFSTNWKVLPLDLNVSGTHDIYLTFASGSSRTFVIVDTLQFFR